MTRAALLRAPLEQRLELGDHCRVQQLAQVGLAQQLAQELHVEGERLRAPLGRG